jgi:flagellar L-ring protein precursor FlgH
MKKIYLQCCFVVSVVGLLQGCMPHNNWKRADPLRIDKINEPMPYVKRTNGAIYQQGSDTYLYGSRRAHRVGDLLTVHVDENLNAQDSMSSTTSRTSVLKDGIGLTSVIKPGTLDITGDNRYAGVGNSQQSNTITGDITVTVIRVLSNSNLVIRGYKTLFLSNGTEKIGISGIVRQIDINSADNSVLSSKIAEAHIAYLGRGDLKRSSSKGWGSKIYSGSIWPL